MSEPVPVPEPSPLPVFHASNLPGHKDNPATDTVIAWPLSPSAVPYMPMAGKYMVQAVDGSQAECTDGFLTVGPDGAPVWSAKPPA